MSEETVQVNCCAMMLYFQELMQILWEVFENDSEHLQMFGVQQNVHHRWFF